MIKRIFSALLAIAIVISLIPVLSFPTLAASTGKKLIITHNVDLGNDLVLQSGSINLATDGSIELDTDDNNKFYRLEQYYPKSSPDGSSYIEKGRILNKIIVAHNGKTYEYPIPDTAPAALQSVNLLQQGLDITGTTFTLQVNMVPANQKRVGILYSKLDPAADITIQFVWATDDSPKASVAAISGNAELGDIAVKFLENSNENAIWQLTAIPEPGYGVDKWEYTADVSESGDTLAVNENAEWHEVADVPGNMLRLTETVAENRVYRARFGPARVFFLGDTARVSAVDTASLFKGFAFRMNSITPLPPAENTVKEGVCAEIWFEYSLPSRITAPANIGVEYSAAFYNGVYTQADFEGDPDSVPEPIGAITDVSAGLTGGIDHVARAYVRFPEVPYMEHMTVVLSIKDVSTSYHSYSLGGRIIQDTIKALRLEKLEALDAYYDTAFGVNPPGAEYPPDDTYTSFADVRFLLRDAYTGAYDAIRWNAQTENEINDAYAAALERFTALSTLQSKIDAGEGEYYRSVPGVVKVAVSIIRTAKFGYAPALGENSSFPNVTPEQARALLALEAGLEADNPGVWRIGYGSADPSIYITSIVDAGGDGKEEKGSANGNTIYAVDGSFPDLGFSHFGVSDRSVMRIGMTTSGYNFPILSPDKDDLIWAIAALREKYADAELMESDAYVAARDRIAGWQGASNDELNGPDGAALRERLQTELDAVLEALKTAFPNDNLNHYDLPPNVLNVIALIRAIGGVTPRSGDAIAAAREAYDALGAEEYNGTPSKDLVSNYKTLTDAEMAYALLQTPVGEAGAALGAALPGLKDAYDANPALGSIGGEWAVLGVARGGLDVSATKTKYLGKLNALLAANGLDGIADGKYTEYSRIVLALSALGVDAETYSVSGAPYNFVPKLTDYDNVVKQGINGPIYALLALDSKPYAPQGTDARNRYVQYILANIHNDGGWSLDDTKAANSDPDITAAALQALANYRHIAGVPAAIESGLAALRTLQDAVYGGFYSFGQYNSESAAQVIVALSELGIDPTGAEWTVGAGKNPVTALLTFYDPASEMFRHTLNGGADAMATEQAAYALVALDRFTRHANTLYKMSDAFGDADDRANKSGLQNAILQAEALAERDYTGETWSVLQTKLSAAQSVYANANAGQDEVDTAKNELLAAIGALEYADIAVNGDVLNAAIAIGDALSAGNYTNSAAASAALSAARTTSTNGSATQTEIDAAKDALLTALAALTRVDAINTELLEKTSSSAITAALSESDYTPETWSAYAGALAAAQTAYQSTHTQFEIDFAAQSLISSIGGLVKASGDDYTAVIALLNAVKSALTESDYTAASWSALQAANGKAGLTAALNGLEIETAIDYALLEAIISQANTLDASRYTEESYETLSVVLVSAQLKRAQNIYAAQDNPQEAIDADAASMLSAMKELQLTRVAGQVNRALLKSLIDRSETLQQPIYTPATWEVFSNALTSAKSVYNDGSAAQSAVDAAKDALLAAIGALETALNKSALQGAITEASAITNAGNDYTAASWLSFESALEYANAILAKAEATQTEISNALRDLNAAIAGLTKTGTSGPGTPEQPGAPTIGVTFRLIGATRSSEDVNLSLGTGDSEYVTWIPTSSYTLNEGATVYDLFMRAIQGAGLSQIGADNNYVSTIYAPSVLGGYKLSEFTNGPYSGWMYTVNGSHPGYGLKERTLRDGDRVIWHYVNDYRHEVRDWFNDLQYPSLGDGTQYNKWLNAPDRAPAAADSGVSGGTGSAPASEIKTEESLGGGTAKVEVKSEDVKAAIDTAKEDGTATVSVTVKGDSNTKIADVTLPKASAKEIADSGLEFVVKSPVGDVSFGKDALETITSQTGDTLEVIIADEGKADIAETNNKMFTLTVKVGDAELTSLGGGVAVALPYAKAPDEDAELLTVYKLEADGTYTEIKDAKYDTASGKAGFTTSETGSYFVSEWISPFADINKSEWYYKSVRYAYSNGLMNGTGDAAYSPGVTLTRAMLVTVLAREAGIDTGGGDTWYSKAVEWGVANGVTDGANPNGEITREQFAAMLYRYAGSPRPNGGFDAYSDANNVSSWAEDAMAWAVESGLITGRTETTLAPAGTATRAEAATLLQRYLERAL
jgi:hypothetical protein